LVNVVASFTRWPAGKFIRPPEERRKFQTHGDTVCASSAFLAVFHTKHPWHGSLQVLRFDCIWDDTASPAGDVHHLVLQASTLHSHTTRWQ
jgi:hypothetical protein